MLVKYGQMTIDGKRIDEIKDDVWTYNERQLTELSNELLRICYNDGLFSNIFDDVWHEIYKRRRFYHRMV